LEELLLNNVRPFLFNLAQKKALLKGGNAQVFDPPKWQLAVFHPLEQHPFCKWYLPEFCIYGEFSQLLGVNVSSAPALERLLFDIRRPFNIKWLAIVAVGLRKKAPAI